MGRFESRHHRKNKGLEVHAFLATYFSGVARGKKPGDSCYTKSRRDAINELENIILHKAWFGYKQLVNLLQVVKRTIDNTPLIP